MKKLTPLDWLRRQMRQLDKWSCRAIAAICFGGLLIDWLTH